MSHTLRRIVLVQLFMAGIGVTLLAPACVGSKRIDPAVNFNASYTQSIKAIEASRDEAVRTLGEGMERGLPIDEQTVLRIGRAVELALNIAKEALAAFIESGGSKAPVYSAMAALNAAMAELIAEATTAGLEVP